jgi:chemotaxis protein MotB
MAGKGRGDAKNAKGAVIIKKINIEEGGHHGGAWKVAYADFVTAMMAFFLLMWLLNATTEDQRKGLADYFSPSNLMSHNSSGTGEPFGGHTAFDEGAMVSDRGAVQVTVGKRPVLENVAEGQDPVLTENHRSPDGDGVGQGLSQDDRDADLEDNRPRGQPGTWRPAGVGGPHDTPMHREPAPSPINRAAAGAAEPAGSGGADPIAAKAVIRNAAEEGQAWERREKAAFAAAAEQIRDAVRSDPALADLARQLAIDVTPDGLRIQILDEVKLPMFPSGSAKPNDRARLLIQKVAPVLVQLNHAISVTGHTDATPFPGPDRTNWELSAERANATRRLLTDAGFSEARVAAVTGLADRDPLLPADPYAAANRRISILVLRGPRPAEGTGADHRLPPIAP